MKTNFISFFLIITVIFVFVSSINAQDEKKRENNEVRTLFSNEYGHVSHGGFLGLSMGYTTIDNEAALQVGGNLAWVINHQFAIGIAGNGFFNNLAKDNVYDPNSYYLAGGYGGLFFQPILFPKSPIHVSFPIILGVGGVAVNHKDKWNYHWDNNYDNNSNYYDSDVFLVFEPGINVELNMLKFMRMSIGASYRLTNNVNLIYEYTEDNIDKSVVIDPASLNNFTVKLGFMFGWF